MACLLQKVLIVNFLLDVVAFCLGVSGNPLFYAITTRRVAEAVGCLDGNTEGASAAWPLIRQDACGLYLRAVSLFVLFVGVARLYGGLYITQVGSTTIAFFSYMAEFLFFALEVHAGTMKLEPFSQLSLSECTKKPWEDSDCDLRSYLPAMCICLSMMVWLLVHQRRPRQHHAIKKNS